MFDGTFGTTYVPRKVEKSNWESWFAWRPVTTLSKHRVWCKPVYRRSVTRYGGDNEVYSVWEYGNMFDMIKEEK